VPLELALGVRMTVAETGSGIGTKIIFVTVA